MKPKFKVGDCVTCDDLSWEPMGSYYEITDVDKNNYKMKWFYQGKEDENNQYEYDFVKFDIAKPDPWYLSPITAINEFNKDLKELLNA